LRTGNDDITTFLGLQKMHRFGAIANYVRIISTTIYGIVSIFVNGESKTHEPIYYSQIDSVGGYNDNQRPSL
jgi:hypothetical protein